jgi:hypothetical protein
MKDRIKDLFTFTGKEQRGLIVLLGLMLLSIAASIFLPAMLPEKQFDITPFQLEVEQFLASAEKADSSARVKTNNFHVSPLADTGPFLAQFLSAPFYFDPNKPTEEEWDKMGMDPKISRNIIRYREKGGKFRNSEGFKKIYGMNDDIFAILEPYLKFESSAKTPQPENNRSNNYNDTSWNDKTGEKI